MSIESRLAELLEPVTRYAADLDQNTLVQKVLTTTLSPAAQSIVQEIIEKMEAWEAAQESDKQAAVATAVQQAQAQPQETEQTS
jgi:hypothetical protein